jgi:DNA-binding transcriptional ArsR family regulator
MDIDKIKSAPSEKRSTSHGFSSSETKASIEHLAGAMKALAYPQRIRILQAISGKGMYFSELSELTGLKTTALNNNLKILIDAELAAQEHPRGRYLATKTGTQILSVMSSVLEGMSPAAAGYMRQYHRLYNLSRKRKQVLDGVPRLGWGKDIECTFFGGLDAMLRFLGEPVDYVYLMGVSAAAFRLMFHQPDWCPSSPDAAANETYAQQALKVVGYKGQFLNKENMDQKEINQIIREEIDKGMPVLAIDLVQVADWGIVTGYQNDKLLCRSYFDKGDEYSIAEKEPWIILKIEKAGPAPPKTSSIRESVKLAVDLSARKEIGHYANGLAAYDVWARDLENETLFSKMDDATFRHYWHVNGWVYDSLYDARVAAGRYLQKIGEEFSGGEKQVISDAAQRFEDVTKSLFDNWIYFTLPFWVRKEEKKTWTPKGMIDTDTWTEDMRKKGADLLRSIKHKEEQAFKVLSQID